MKTFRGGVHPHDHKEHSAAKPIVDVAPPQELIFPLSQHIGAPATACVKVKDQVLMGQKIAEASGFVSANIHASVSGTVKAIEKRLHPNGSVVECIVIENDGKDTPVDALTGPDRAVEDLSKKEILSAIQEAGIVGMGGATFPTHVKLSPPAEAKIEYAIINGAECEPYLTSDYRAMLESPKDILTGLSIIMKLFDLSDGYIGIESNKPKAIEVMTAAAKEFAPLNIHIVPLKTKYPQGAEKQLIAAITGRKIKTGQLPWQVGCVVSNIDTAAAIFRAVVKNTPLIKRIVTMGGDALANAANFRVRIGTPFAYLIEQLGEKEPIEKLIMGGPMMGTSVPNREVPVIKGTSGILAFGKKSAHLDTESACLRCGKCVYVCPMGLQPNLLDAAARANDFDTLKKLNLSDCMECGSCAFTCPSKRRQVQQIKVAKVKIRDIQTKAK